MVAWMIVGAIPPPDLLAILPSYSSIFEMNYSGESG
jgi:hypothetical protein